VERPTYVLKNSTPEFFHQLIRKKIFCVAYTPQRFPSHLKYVVTVPCEIRKCYNVTEFSR